MSTMERVPGALLDGALAEKVNAAERGIAVLRLLVVLGGWITYPLLDKAGTRPWLVYLLLSGATLYALGLYLLGRESGYRKPSSVAATSVLDVLFTLLWLYATGGIHSPFLISVLLAVVTAGIRFTPRQTVLFGLALMVGYLALLALTGQAQGRWGLVVLHIVFILLSCVLGQLVSRLLIEQLVAKLELQKRLEMEEQLARSEAALAEAQAIAHTGSWSWELSTGQHTWSSELYRILGRAPGEPASADTFLECVHPEARPSLQLALAHAQADGQPFQGEYRLLHPSGEVRWIHLKGQVVADASGQPARMSGTAQDITERKAMEKRLVIADRMAALGTLAGGIAHEINNPLTFITTNLMWLEECLLPGDPKQLPPIHELRGAVSDAREGASRVRNIVRELKSFSRVDEARHQPVDVHRGLEFSLNIAAQEIRPRARLVRDFGEVPHVLGDETRLGQVFLNLLMNAAQAIPEGRPEANTITVRTRVAAPGQVVVEISDTGVGIPPELLERIFDPFFTTKPMGVGTGLGLSICHGIVSALGGQISVQSELGKGTTFSVTLPATDAPLLQGDETPVPSSPVRARLLLIDDEPMVAASLSRMLRAEYDVSTSSGAEALRRMLEGEPFDVILCDLGMPDISGMDLYARLHAERPALAARMIFLTGGAVTQRAQEFISQARYWVEKPVELPTLRALLQEVMRESAASRR
ncbi:MAG: PAS domain-containing protein [Myxococcaceae bacterium]|nr:PAS domain-containing protein [Myxococcaceae bacterium]